MPANVDEPVRGTIIDPLGFFVRGWLWLEHDQARIAAVELWEGSCCIGQTADLILRDDVCVALSLPPGSRAGYEIFAEHLNARPNESFELDVRVRFQDDARSGVIIHQPLRVAERQDWLRRPRSECTERSHEARVRNWLVPLEESGAGIEIGAFKNPVSGIRPIYVDCYATFGPDQVNADYYGDACALPFRSNSLSYVVASHVLEHVANPIAALAEWYRVLHPGGIIYLVLPDRRFTWDRCRPLTTVAHMMDDYLNNQSPVDPTHVDDFPPTPRDHRPWRADQHSFSRL
jgi:hypothetical protein